MKNLFTLLLSTLICIVFFNTSVSAVTLTSTQSGNWSSPSTWGGTVPGPGDGVIIDGGFNVSVDVATAVCLSLQLGGSLVGSGDGTLSFASGSQLTVSGMVTFGIGNRKGSMTMAGGGILTCEGFITNSIGTWTHGSGTVELTASNLLPNNGIVIFNNLTISGGTTTLNSNTTVAADLLINSGGTLDGAIKQLTIGGDWVNNGTFSGNAGTVIFNRNGNQTISGSGLNNFNLIKLNMVSISNILEVLSTNFSAPDAFLTLSGGTLKMSGTYTLTNSFILGPSYNIQPADGLWINNPNVTVTAQAGGVSLRGLLRISAGTVNIGTAADHNLDYVAGASLIVEGGALSIAGHLGRNNAVSSISYNQSGGIVTTVKEGSTDPVFGGFDIGAPASSFTMTGGTIVVSNATSAPADYIISASTQTVTGGTLQIGDANTLNAQTIRIQTAAPVGNLLVSDATSKATKPTARLLASSLNVIGNITMQAGTTLDANGMNITLGGDWSDNGTFIPGPMVTFDGSGTQSLNKTGAETFNGLTVSKTNNTLTMNSSANVNAAFSLSQGTLAVGINTLTLNGSVTGGGVLTSSATGTVSYNRGSDGQNVLAANYGNIFFSNFNKTLASTGITGISGVFTPGSATGHTITGSTIDFNGDSQGIPSFGYNNLTLSGSGTKTGSGTIKVNGDLTNNIGIVFAGTTLLELDGTTHTNNGTISAATLLIGPGANYLNTGTTSTSIALTGTGTLTQSAAAILNIGSTADITALNASVAGNTVNYTGVSQAVRQVGYYHLTLSGSGTPTLAGVSIINGNLTLSGTVALTVASGIIIDGDLTIGSNSTFGAGSFSHFLAGNFSNSGTFTAGTSTFTLNGTTVQTLNGGTFYNLTLNNPAGISLLGDVKASNNLTLTSGSFSIGAHILTLDGSLTQTSGTLNGGTSSNLVVEGSGASITVPSIILNNFTLNRAKGISMGGNATINGKLTISNGTLTTGDKTITLGPAASLAEATGQTVLGNITTTRNVSANSGTETFGNIGAVITLNGVAPGITTVLRKTGTISSGAGHSSIKRYFDITPTVNTGLMATIDFHYDMTEVNSQNPAAFELFRSRDAGLTWNNMGGTVNTLLQAITITGMNDLSRFTASDTSNRIGNTATPALASISPSTKGAGDAAFVMILTGSDFVAGKSVIRINGISKPTTYVNSNQITTLIPASDLLVMGTFQVSVFNPDGGGISASKSFTVTAGAPVSVTVETAADGSGTTVQSQSLHSGSSITMYAVTRDSFNNFVANVAASSWSFVNASGGIASADLVPATDGKSAVFTAHIIGATGIKATSGVLVANPSGNITVTAGTAVEVNVETAADGTGKVVPDQIIIPASSLSVYAISRDAAGNFISNVAADSWSLENITGRFLQSDLVAAGDLKSATFTGNHSGSANIKCISGSLVAIASGLITIESATGISETEQMPVFRILQNYPNPFITSTTLTWELPASSHVIIKIYSLQGKETSTLVNETQDRGTHSYVYEPDSSLPAGIYFVKLQAGYQSATIKMNLAQ